MTIEPTWIINFQELYHFLLEETLDHFVFETAFIFSQSENKAAAFNKSKTKKAKQNKQTKNKNT